MPAEYASLIPIYDQIGMAQFAEKLTPQLINYAQRTGWMGRRILDLGCGTGVSLSWLARSSYIPIGVDYTPQMLDRSRERLQTASLDATFLERDIRELGRDFGTIDLALGLDILNEFTNLRDLEIIFKNVFNVLGQEKLFIFDMYTIQGLTERARGGDSIMINDANLSLFSRSQYDYERQVEELHYTCFQQHNAVWQRSQALRTLRAYPAQAVTSLLQRSGFQDMQVLNLSFEPFEPGLSSASRVIFIAKKP